MDISTYLQKSPRGTAAALARAIGVHPVMVSQWAKGKKDIPVERCAALERATAGAVRRWDMRADWHEHWPELVGAAGAPAVPGAEPPAAAEDKRAGEDRRKVARPIAFGDRRSGADRRDGAHA